MWTVRASAASSVGLALVIFFVFGPDAIGLMVVTLILLPYGRVLWHERKRAVKSGLALAIGWGSLMFIFPAYETAFLMIAPERDTWMTRAGLGLFALSQAALVTGVIKTYYKLDREPKDAITLAWGIAQAVLHLFASLILIAVMGSL